MVIVRDEGDKKIRVSKVKYLPDESKWMIWTNETIDIVESDPNWIEKGYDKKHYFLTIFHFGNQKINSRF